MKLYDSFQILKTFVICWKSTNFLFVDVALRAASILKNRAFLYLMSVIQVSKQLYLAVFEPREYARSIGFEKYADCTSQRLKRTSGVRVITFLL